MYVFSRLLSHCRRYTVRNLPSTPHRHHHAFEMLECLHMFFSRCHLIYGKSISPYNEALSSLLKADIPRLLLPSIASLLDIRWSSLCNVPSMINNTQRRDSGNALHTYSPAYLIDAIHWI
jgi:hypothetical protein